MLLKQVKIVGFKSFADKTLLEFHQGITCIVGPNGCGKSNIADAIRWVLGEQSAKSLRGGKMPDVIFAGTSTRKSLPFAEVTITFSDIGGVLPLPYDEISITRRLVLSGESEYFVNNQPARLKDIHHLFLDSGVGKNNFSIFEQGKIDQIIHFSPQERRYIFDDASGITRFLQQKKETLKRLEEVSLNVSRLADIHQEVEKQIATLKVQSEEALEFKNYQERLVLLEKEFAYQRFVTLQERMEHLRQKEATCKANLGCVEEENSKLADLFKTSNLKVAEVENSLQRLKEELFNYQNDRNLWSQDAKHDSSKLQALQEKQNKMQKELKQLQNARNGWEEEIKRLLHEKEKLQAEVGEAKVQLEKRESVFKGVENKLREARHHQTLLHKERITAFQKQVSLEGQLKQTLFRQETHQEKKQHLLARKNNFKQVIDEKLVQMQAKQQHYEETCEEIAAAKSSLLEGEKELKKIREQLAIALQNLNKIGKLEQNALARQKVLEQLKTELAGFSSGSKKLLQAAQDKKNPIYSLVSGLHVYIQPLKAQQKQVNAALKPYAQTLVVENKKDISPILEYAKQNDIADFSLICLEGLPKMTRESSQFVTKPGPLSDHLLKDRWSDTGCWIDEKQVWFFPGSSDQTIFTREAELNALKEELEDFSRQKMEAEDAVEKMQKKEKLLQEQLKSFDQDFRKKEMQGVEANFTFQKAKSDYERLFKEIQQIEEEIGGVDTIIASLDKEITKTQQELKNAETALKAIQEKAETIDTATASEELTWKNLQNALSEVKEQYHSLQSHFHKISHTHHLMESKDGETKRLIERLEKENSFAQKEVEQILSTKDGKLEKLHTLQHLIEKEQAAVEKKTEALAADKIKRDALEKKMKSVEQNIKDATVKLHDLAIQMAHAETAYATLCQDVQERFSTSCENFKEIQTGSENCEKEIKKIKGLLEKYGNVNLASIEDCDKQTMRLNELTYQMDDMGGAKKDLLEMMEKLTQDSSELFVETFQKVRVNFQKNFALLFKGGEADLELLDKKNVLESGIEIHAKPPGKQMRALSLLSGGEKCLTAMALLFAIFEVKASPFCILDEIDAPLDDTNVERFLNVVKEYAHACQFIIVTHNKRTMALADRLYGVSMEEKGVSKLLRMEFSHHHTPELV